MMVYQVPFSRGEFPILHAKAVLAKNSFYTFADDRASTARIIFCHVGMDLRM